MRSIFKGEEVRAGGWPPVIGGLLAATDATWLECQKLPQHGHLPFLELLTSGARFVLVPCLAAFAVSWLLWRRMDVPPFGFGRFVFHAGVAWVLIPPIGLLLRMDSAMAVLLMLLATLVSAVALQRLFPGVDAPLQAAGSLDGVSFALLPPPDSAMGRSFVAALALYAALILFVKGQVTATGLLLSGAACLLLWHWRSLVPQEKQAGGNGSGAARMASAFVLAILVTTITLTVLIDGRWTGHSVQAATDAERREAEALRRKKRDGEYSSGYTGIILWTVPKKKEIVAPAPVSLAMAAASKRRPLVIPFDGPYWYFQYPHRAPGRDAHKARGDPTGVNIQSTDRLPLLMEAHQSLASPVSLASCGALDIDIRNADNARGSVLLGVVLTDSRSAGKPSLLLGAQKVVSTEDAHFSIKNAPVEEELRYRIPQRRGIPQFDQITVVFLPAEERSILGAKIAIEQFRLIPR
jgi:hypothetical protein